MRKSVILALAIIFQFSCIGLSEGISIPFEMVNGLIVVEAEIDGKKNNFIVDSGSNSILINGKQESADASFTTISGDVNGSEQTIKSLKVGELEIGELLGFSTDLSNLEVYLERPLGGILGYSVFTPHSVTFDFQSSALLISEEPFAMDDLLGYDHIDFTIQEELPLTTIEIDGRELAFIIDTGASAHFIDKSLLESSALKYTETGRSKNIFTASDNSTVSQEILFSGQHDSNSFWSGKSAYVKDFSKLSKELGREIGGLISLNQLSAMKVHFDLDNKIMYF